MEELDSLSRNPKLDENTKKFIFYIFRDSSDSDYSGDETNENPMKKNSAEPR